MCPGRNVYIIPYGSYTTLRRPKGLKQIILWSSIQWNNPSNKLNGAKVLELGMQKWLGSFHQLDLQTLHSAWTFQNCDAKARVDHEDAKVIGEFSSSSSDLHQAKAPEPSIFRHLNH